MTDEQRIDEIIDEIAKLQKELYKLHKKLRCQIMSECQETIVDVGIPGPADIPPQNDDYQERMMTE